jgi:hypothetical protein
MSINLIGPYHGDSYGGNGTHTAACGWPGLRIGRTFKDGRAAPFEIVRDGVTIGFAARSSFRYNG